MIRHIGPYSAIAGFCALLNILILILCDAAGMPLAFSVALSFMACVAAGYILHSRYTFRNANSFAGLLRYGAVMSLNYPLTLLALWLLKDTLHLSMMIAAPTATGMLTIYNYLSSRWAILNGKPLP